MRKPRLTEEILRKMEYIDENKGPDGLTRLYSTSLIRNLPGELFEYNVDGEKISLSKEGYVLLRWCR